MIRPSTIRVLLPGFLAALALFSLACGPKPRPIPDGGDEDAGVDAGVDAGRPRGDDPPLGWSTAVELPSDAGTNTKLGLSVASAPDQHQQPLIAALYDDPNDDGLRVDTRVFFTRWNGETKAFQDLKTVEVVGEVDVTPPHRQISVARDDVTGRIGIAYLKGTDSVRLAYSDDEGANFSLITVSAAPGGAAVSDPQVAMHDGTLHVAYVQDGALKYRKRVGTGAFTEQDAPAVSGSSAVRSAGLSLALDGAFNPGLVYFVSDSGLGAHLGFWRPGTGTATQVATSNTIDVSSGARLPSASLTFAGELPRVAYHLRNEEPLGVDDKPELFYAAATDAAGTAWGTPVAIPRNGNATTYNSTRWYQAVVAEASGAARVAAYFGGNGTVGAQCGGPKLASSGDGVTFTTCSPAQSPYNFAGEWVSAWNYAAGKLTLVFHYDARTNPNAKPGIALWRER